MNTAATLLRWYDAGKRDLPWRRTPSPYRTLVSEFMLQQTVVATVIPYFHRFTERFPDLACLADADEQDVLALWSGLGYYSRARNLHRAAQRVRAVHGGTLPGDESALRELPGVGPYTAAAIAAIAFGVRTFALDGNAARVVARLFAVGESIDVPATREALRKKGLSLVPRTRSGDFAQAVMELGARICVSGKPRCPQCPISAACQALAVGRETAIPIRKARVPKRLVQMICVGLQRDGQTLLALQPAGALLGGTWTLPSVEVNAGASAASVTFRAAQARRALGEMGLRVSGRFQDEGAIRHVFTHLQVTAQVLRATVSALAPDSPTLRGTTRWTTAAQRQRMALSSFTKKTLALIEGDPASGQSTRPLRARARP